jgi:hypothetical protein
MHRLFFACFALTSLAFVPLTLASPAAAQETLVLEDPNEAAAAEDLAYARYLNDVGMGLTIGGLVTHGVSLTGVFTGGLAGAIAGGTFAGAGGVLSLAGIPMWIVGSLRSNILSARLEDRDRVAWDYELAGMVTTLVSLGISLIGAGLIAGSIMTANAYRGFGVERTHEPLAAAGGILIPIGFFTALFIGTPMWADAARF